ncbi:MAG: hypothetical protein KAH07_07985 [Flavobacteriaceae bacterium]|nr:hypothetical protein [Flavobacteriaceae bacterium]
MKNSFKIIFFIFFVNSSAQVDYSNNWEDFFSYNNVKDFIKVENKVYAVVDNAVFSYDIDSKETEKLSSINGLSGEIATSIHYSSEFKKLVIGYSNGLIEIVNSKGEIITEPDISNFILFSERKINDIVEFEGLLYISTPFAIVVYDIENLEFGDTYFIGPASSDLVINEVEILNNTIYAATEDGFYTADINEPNLIDFNNWVKHSSGLFSSIEVFSNEVYIAKGNVLYRINASNSLEIIRNIGAEILKIKASNTNLSANGLRKVDIFDLSLSKILTITSDINSEYYYQLNAALVENSKVYLGTQEFGILETSLLNNTEFQEIHPEGPSSNSLFSIDVLNNNLWVVYGGYSSSYVPLNNKYGYSHFNGENWVNIPYDKNFPGENLVHTTIDPNHENKVFISSWAAGNKNDENPETGGILIVENDKPIEFWNDKNSALEEVLPDHPSYVSIRVNGTSFDRDGNLWVTNAFIDNMLKKVSPSGHWSSFNLSSILTNTARGLNELEIDKSGSIWIGTRRNGVLIFNEKGHRKRSLTTTPTKGSLPDLNVRTVAVDDNNSVWIGTQKGLVVYYNASGVFDAHIYDAKPIIILDEGVPKRLLGDLPINSIAIDGADNKWFATDGGGALQSNANGQETLNLFNKSNSPLPSNKILKIAIDKSNGKVYFGTDKGIVAFGSGVAPFGDELGEVYAYPNPSTKTNEFITIDGRNGTHLPQGTNVKIVDTAGYLVYETNVILGQELKGGKVTWNKTNLAGRKVASGIYIVLLSNKDSSETSSTKIAIIN